MSNPRSSSKKRTDLINIILATLFHVVVIGVITVFAAREGMLGKKFKQIAVTIVPKQKVEQPKKPEAPKQKPPDETPPPKQPQENAQPRQAPSVTPPPVSPILVASAPPPPSIPASFDFTDGARPVQVSSDPMAIYKSLLEYTLHSSWSYPKDNKDHSIFCEVEVGVDPNGVLTVQTWKRPSGIEEWDSSVRKVFQDVHAVRRPPPPGFPKSVVVRFDLVARQIASAQ